MQQTNPVIDKWGTKFWYQNGVLHRVNGPAIEYTDGSILWYQHGLKHRINGAAAEYSNGIQHWYSNGVEYSEEQFRLLAFVNSQVTV